VILLAAIAALGVVGLSPAAAGTGQVPFTAHTLGTPVWTSPTTVETHGVGNATHVGRFTNSGVIVLSTPTGTCADGGPNYPNVHTETLTTVAGDTLVIRILGLACQTGPDSWKGTGTWSVIGGTGRFEGTTGQGTIDGRADFGTGECEFDLKGTISRP
jgi:hypothetical protein